jgi:hypothetical protein
MCELCLVGGSSGGGNCCDGCCGRDGCCGPNGCCGPTNAPSGSAVNNCCRICDSDSSSNSNDDCCPGCPCYKGCCGLPDCPTCWLPYIPCWIAECIYCSCVGCFGLCAAGVKACKERKASPAGPADQSMDNVSTVNAQHAANSSVHNRQMMENKTIVETKQMGEQPVIKPLPKPDAPSVPKVDSTSSTPPKAMVFAFTGVVAGNNTQSDIKPSAPTKTSTPVPITPQLNAVTAQADIKAKAAARMAGAGRTSVAPGGL